MHTIRSTECMKVTFLFA